MPIANLLPDDYKTMRERRRAFRVCVLLTPVVMCIVVAALLVSKHTFDQTLGVRNAVAGSYEEAQSVVSRMVAAEVKRAAMLEQSRVNASLLEKVPRSCALAMVINCLPAQTAITRFELDARNSNRRPPVVANGPDGTPAGPSDTAQPPGCEVRIAGLAATDVGVGKFITNLSRERLVASVALQYSRAKVDQDGVREFQILMVLKANPEDPRAAGQSAKGPGSPGAPARPLGEGT